MTRATFVLVGGGLAAATAAETLREQGFDGTIRMIAAEAHHPYLRPPLSKEYLTGAGDRAGIVIHPTEWYADHAIEIETGTTAAALDHGAHTVTLADGRILGYDRLLMATGASPRRVDAPGATATGIHSLRTVEDSEGLKAAFAHGDRQVVIVGAGWIGLEVAAAARGHGNRVTVIGREQIPLAGPLGDEMGTMFRELHESHGVEFVLSAEVERFTEQGGVVTGIALTDRIVPTELVVVGVGAIPNIQLAAASGLECDNGVLADEHLLSSAPDVYVAGDVANAFHPVIRQRMRNEHWANAIGTGKIAARSMLGQSAVFDEIPYFYTDQYDLGMEYSGYPTLARDAELVVRGDRTTREFIAFWTSGGKVVAGMNVNVWDVHDTIRELIRSQRLVDPTALADPSVELSAL